MSVKQRVQQLVALVEQGKIIEAIEEFYADDVTMQENLMTPTVGKAANLRREREFVDYIASVHESRATDVIVEGDRAVINWRFSFTGRDGKRFDYDQIAYQIWDGERIVRERFVYDPTAVTNAA